jgi:signal transduction histidine kinase
MLDVHSSFNLKRFIVAAIFGMFVLAASVFLGVNYAVDRAVSMDARTKAEDWAKYFINTMPDLNRLLVDGKLDGRQNNVVSTAAKVGNVFRFKLYDAQGKTILESDPETFEKKADADHIDDDALDIVTSKISMISLNDGTKERNMPSLYAEAYVPVLKANGDLRAIVETYVDQTKTAEFFKRTFGVLTFGLGLAMALAFGVPTLAYLVRTKQAREVKLRAEILAVSRDAAEKSEGEALKAAAKLKELNESVTILNTQLWQKAEELQSAQEEIVRKGKMAQLGSLIATVAHELRNPLGVVRSTVFLLNRRVKETGIETANLIARIDSGIKRCDDIISQLLEYSRSQALDTTPTDVDFWLEAILEDQAVNQPAELSINCVLGLQGLQANIDPERTGQAINNLITNSVEAMTHRGHPLAEMAGRTLRIDVSTRQTGRGIEIAIEDNGPGIPPELIDKIREPLFSTKGFGTGLGIPAVEKIMKLHGGGLEIHSVPGHGARFTIWIPTTQQVQQAA